MKFLGLDSAATTGWAFQRVEETANTKRTYWETGVIRADSPQKYDILEFAKEHGVTHAVVEKPMPFAGSAAAVGQSMNISYGRWVEACERVGLEVVPALVSSWQSHMLVVNGKRIQQKQDGDDKAGSKLVAAYHGAAGCGGDEADAVCLCLYGPVARSREAVKEEAKREARAAKQKAYREKRKVKR